MTGATTVLVAGRRLPPTGARRPVRRLHARARRAHARRCSTAGPTRLIGLDRDAEALAVAADAAGRVRGDRVELVHADYRDLDEVLDAPRRAARSTACSPISACRRCSSTARGAASAFRRDEPLDMRMDRSAGATAADLVTGRREAELADAICRYGEERHSRRIARAIVERATEAPVATTGELATVVRRRRARRGPGSGSTRRRGRSRRCASGSTASSRGSTRSSGRPPGGWRAGGRLAVITFHSLEDRIVKHTFRALGGRRARVSGC